MTTLTLSYVDWETHDQYAEEVRGDHGEVIDYVPDPGLPEEFHAEAAYLLSHPDEVMCGLANMMDEGSGQMCSNPVGWVLYEPDEPGDRGGLQWRWTTLVATSRGAVAVCEECSPAYLYENARDNNLRS